MRIWVYTFFLIGMSLNGISDVAWGENKPLNYATSSAIEADELGAGPSRVLNEFALLPPREQRRAAFPFELCKQVVTKPAPSPDQLKFAMALVEAELVPEVVFQRDVAPEHGESKSIRYSFTFSPDAVLIRSSNPRYPSQAAGLNVVFNSQESQVLWYEGKQQLSVFFIVPPVKDCGLQLVVACPRTYTGYRTLEDSNLSVTGVRYQLISKAEGLFKAPSGQEGKVQASTLATSRVSLPSSWSSYGVSSENPSVSLNIDTTATADGGNQSVFPVSLPLRDAVETRLEFGTPSEVKRTVRTRATVEVSPIMITNPRQVALDGSETTLQPGRCFIISRRKESHY